MDLAKPHLDLGLFSNQLEPQLEFWQRTVGLPFDHIGKVGGGTWQHRHHMLGSILKMNHARAPLPPAPPSGYVELLIARDDLDAPRHLIDPDGNRVTLVPRGCEGVEKIGIVMTVNNRDAHDHFWRAAMQFESPRKGVYRCGDSLLIVGGEGKVDRCDEWRSQGFRYITVQIRDCVAEHTGILARGGTEGRAPIVLGDTVRYSFVRDPDGNFIEISQRASLTGGHL
ncbi:MAG: VOC family protein [Rhodospirillales bacterium]|nr:MAG: VOC family protein [Rhodospirillales bacterium]